MESLDGDALMATDLGTRVRFPPPPPFSEESDTLRCAFLASTPHCALSSNRFRAWMISLVRQCTAWSVARDAPLFFILFLIFSGPGHKSCQV